MHLSKSLIFSRETHSLRNTGRFSDHELEFPINFIEYIGFPKVIYIRHLANEEIYIYLGNSAGFVQLFKFWIRKKLHKMEKATYVFDPFGSSETITYKTKKFFKKNLIFGIANYNPMFQLMPINEINSTTAKVNAETWRDIENYHEHLKFDLQDKEAHEISKFICATIIERVANPKRILEIGCGSGRNLVHLANAFPEAEIIGVDINPAASFNSDFPANVNFIQSNVLEFGINKLERFDLILTVGFLMHINHQDLPGLLRNIIENSDNQLFWELHGISHHWDFHRYPRNYSEVLNTIGYGYDKYQIFHKHPVYSYELTDGFSHAMLHRRTT